MRIAALYIPSGYLPHIFGDNHQELTLNFGGRHPILEKLVLKINMKNPSIFNLVFKTIIDWK